MGGEKGAAVYAQAREHLDLIDARSAMNQQLYATAMQQVLADPDEVERAKSRLVGDALRKHVNIEATVAKAGQYLEADSTLRLTDQSDDTRNLSPGDDGSNPHPSGSDMPQDDFGHQRPMLDSDWAATWNSLAENASSDELRDRLGRVLAGELKRPGAYSRATLRAFSELEQEDLEAFRGLTEYRFGTALHPPKGWYNKNTDVFRRLSEAGLTLDSGLEMLTQISCRIDSTGEYGTGIVGDDVAVIIKVSSEITLQFPVVQLTKVGIAVARLMMGSDERSLIANIVADWDKNLLKLVTVGPYTKEGKNLSINNGTVIYRAPLSGGITVPVGNAPPAGYFGRPFV